MFGGSIMKEKDIIIEVKDSHLQDIDEYYEDLTEFYCEVYQANETTVQEYIALLMDYEYQYAVKWFEVCAYLDKKLIGFQRILRNPDHVTEWLFCDLHILPNYRRRGIATSMYKKAIELVKRYYSTERVIASIEGDNKISVSVHEKNGFHNTLQKSKFANFEFADNETIYERWIFNCIPAKDTEIHIELLLPMWIAYLKEIGQNRSEEEYLDSLQKRIKVSTNSERVFFDIIWCGDNAAGFVFYSIDGGIKNLLSPGLGYIMEFYIKPEYRHKYLASQVIDELYDFFHDKGCPSIYLTSSANSIEFYKKLGFIDSELKDPDNKKNILIKKIT